MTGFARTAALLALFPLRYYAYLTEPAAHTVVTANSSVATRGARL